MSKKVTIQDIARELKTTPSTISRALNGSTRISEDKRKEVLRVAKKLGYRRNHVASSLRSGKSNVMGVVVPFIDSAFFSSIIRGIEEAVDERGFNIMICQSHDNYEREVKCVETLLAAGVATIAISVSGEVRDYDHILKARDLGTSIILFDRVVEDIGQFTVILDDYQGAYQAVSHLVEVGYKKIALLIGNRKINVYRERYRGYKDAIEAHGLTYNEDYVISVESKVEEGKAAAKRLMKLDSPPDAILASDDFSALGAMQECTKRLKIPEQLGIIGFSNERFTQYVSPSLSTIDQQSYKMGKLVGRSFIELQNSNDEIADNLITLLKPELILRDSTKKNQLG